MSPQGGCTSFTVSVFNDLVKLAQFLCVEKSWHLKDPDEDQWQMDIPGL